MEDKFFNDLKEKIQTYFEPGGSHSFDHTQRVYNMALIISKDEKVDLDVIKAAVLLHDIARLKEDNNEIQCHAEEGAKLAKNILENIKFPKEKIEAVCHAIEVHRYSKGLPPKTKEAEIIQDADRLDALGAICIGRMFSTGGKIGIPMYTPDIPIGKIYPGYHADSTIHSFHSRILKLTPETFKTKKAKELAEGRCKFIQEFLDRFVKEWEGKL